jgi:hypothetical protein
MEVTFTARRSPAVPLVIQVHRAGETMKTAKNAVCILVRTPGGARIAGWWMYGTEPEGYRLQKCAPLIKGTTYDVLVEGAGAGLARFAVESDGRVRGVPVIDDSPPNEPIPGVIHHSH